MGLAMRLLAIGLLALSTAAWSGPATADTQSRSSEAGEAATAQAPGTTADESISWPPAPSRPVAAAPPRPLPHDLSPWGMFLGADRVVKAVMIGLAFASLVTWTVWLAKGLELVVARRTARRASAAIVRAATLAEAAAVLDRSRGPAALLLEAARQELALSAGALDLAGRRGVKERVASRLSRIETQAARRAGRGTGVLATIGSTAPFVGLFGTVWGIMNAFVGISAAQTTNLAVVAPGIAEALLATALGLVAAIPAVVVYNLFARSLVAYRQLLADASAGVERLVSRDLDLAAASRRAAAAD